MSKSKSFEINWLGSAGSALGAVSAAVLLSTLGAGGTLIGAALGSLIITAGGSIYTQTLQKTKKRVVGVRAAGTESDSGSSGATSADNRNEGSGPASSPLTGEPPKKTLEQTLRGLPWKRITGLAVGLFVATMAIILVFELSTGRPVSSYTGGSSDTQTGTTFSGLGSGSEDTNGSDAKDPDEKSTSTEQPTDGESTKAKPAEEKPADPPPADEPPADQPRDSDE